MAGPIDVRDRNPAPHRVDEQVITWIADRREHRRWVFREGRERLLHLDVDGDG